MRLYLKTVSQKQMGVRDDDVKWRYSGSMLACALFRLLERQDVHCTDMRTTNPDSC